MHRITIIRADNAVYLDGDAILIDCSSLAPDVRAIQWFADKGEGWIEFVNDGSAAFRPNEKITDFSAYEKFVSAWTREKANQPPVTIVPRVLPQP